MSIAYSIIKAETALRSAQLAGTSSTSLETSYIAYTLDGAEIPESSFKTQIINIEVELSHIIASDISHPYRSYISGVSSALVNLASTPTEDDAANPFIGLFDTVVDGTTGQPLTAQPTETLLDYQDPFFDDTDLYNFAIMGNTIQHTRATAKMVGCVFNRDDRDNAYDADGTSPLPPILANTWIAGVMANIGQVGWTDGAGAVGIYGNLYQQGLQILKMGDGQGLNLPLASQNVIAG